MARVLLAAMTFSVLRAPYGHGLVQGFDDITPDVFAEAEHAAGFVDRATPSEDVDWMTNFQKDWGEWGPFAVPRFYLDGTAQDHTRQAQTLSLWTDLKTFTQFVFQAPLHRSALKDREAWFGSQDWPIYGLWWTTDKPSWREASLRLEHLHDHGPTPLCFDFHQPFDCSGRAFDGGRRLPAGR